MIFQVQFEGITGNIEFAMDGSPYNKMYDIVNFRDNGVLSVVGNWSSDRDPNLALYRQVSWKSFLLLEIQYLPCTNLILSLISMVIFLQLKP